VQLSKTQKTSLNYLLQEALENGRWELVSAEGNSEKWVRGDETVTIAKNLLRSTEPPSVIFEVFEPEINFRRTDSLVMNLLCLRLAKSSKMSSWYDKLSTTTE
jgi:hypothetical protein